MIIGQSSGTRTIFGSLTPSVHQSGLSTNCIRTDQR